jgi:hypothetical protein
MTNTNKVIACSFFLDMCDHNVSAELLNGEDNIAPIIHSCENYDAIYNADQSTNPPKDKSNITTLIDAQIFQVCIKKLLENKFLLSVNYDESEGIIT